MEITELLNKSEINGNELEFLLQKNYQKVLIIWENFVHSISTK